MKDPISYIKRVLSSVKPLPPHQQKFGSTVVSWYEGKPGDAVVIGNGGSAKDQILAEKIVAEQLKAFGYKRATFHFAVDEEITEVLDREKSFTDEDENLNAQQRERVIQRQDNWNDLVEKAKRIVNTGGVTLVRNSKEFVAGNVRGDHGNYESEITRLEPESQAITGWHCTCPWNQFAWQRTRQWKIYEGRPCSHVLALYYVAKMAPVEKEEEFVSRPPDVAPPQVQAPAGELSPFAVPPGAPQAPGTPEGQIPSVPRGPRGLERLTPFKPEDVGAASPEKLLEQRLGPLAPRVPEVPEEEQENLYGLPGERPSREPRPRIQRPPLEILKERQRQEQQFTRPGEAPHGSPAPPGTVSVPGARMPNERNPIQFPGGTYSKTILNDSESLSNIVGQNIRISRPIIVMNVNDSYVELPKGTEGRIAGYDPTTELIDVEFGDVRCYISASEV